MNRNRLFAAGVASLLAASSNSAQSAAPPTSGPGHPWTGHSTAGHPVGGGSTHSATHGGAGIGHAGGVGVGSAHANQDPGAGGRIVPSLPEGRNARAQSGSGIASSGGYRGTTDRSRHAGWAAGAVGHTGGASGSSPPVAFGIGRNNPLGGTGDPGGISQADFAKILAFLQAMGAASSGPVAPAPGATQLLGGTGLGDREDGADPVRRPSITGMSVAGPSAGGSYRGTTRRGPQLPKP